MRSGELDRRITLKRRSVAVADANGSKVQTYAPYATVWAGKIDAGGREYSAAQQTQAELATRFKIRYRADLLPTDRIAYDGKDYNISHTQELGRKEGLIVFATAVVNA